MQKSKTIEPAEKGLVDSLNWYNHQRIHSALAYNASAQMLEGDGISIQPLPYDYWHEAAQSAPSKAALQQAELSGTIECTRLVENEGIVKLGQGETLRLPPVLAGQYVRLEFDVQVGKHSFGRAVWESQQEIVVAEYAHRLGCGGDGKSPVVYDTRWRDLGEAPRNEAYDALEYEYGYTRRQFTKRPKRSE